MPDAKQPVDSLEATNRGGDPVVGAVHTTSEASFDDVVQHTAQVAPTLVPCTHAGVIAYRDGSPTFGASDDAAHRLDVFQVTAQHGPAAVVAQLAGVVHVPSTLDDPRWPEFCRQAISHGVRSALAAPLPVHGVAIGVLTLYSGSERAFTGYDETVASFAAHTALVLAVAQAHDTAVTVVRELRAALSTRGIVEQAEGVLIARNRCTAADAYALLADRATRQNRPLHLVAADVVTDAQQR